MSSKPTDNCYIFIIDTDQYSGNFERELCAFITGQYGDCGNGDMQSDIFYEEIGLPEYENKFSNTIKQVPDEHGCYRPVSIWETPGWGNSGMGEHEKLTSENKEKYTWPAYQSVGIYFDEKPDQEMIELMKTRSLLFSEKYGANPTLHEMSVPSHEPLTITGFRLINYKVKTEEIEEEI